MDNSWFFVCAATSQGSVLAPAAYLAPPKEHLEAADLVFIVTVSATPPDTRPGGEVVGKTESIMREWIASRQQKYRESGPGTKIKADQGGQNGIQRQGTDL